MEITISNKMAHDYIFCQVVLSFHIQEMRMTVSSHFKWTSPYKCQITPNGVYMWSLVAGLWSGLTLWHQSYPVPSQRHIWRDQDVIRGARSRRSNNLPISWSAYNGFPETNTMPYKWGHSKYYLFFALPWLIGFGPIFWNKKKVIFCSDCRIPSISAEKSTRDR